MRESLFQVVSVVVMGATAKQGMPCLASLSFFSQAHFCQPSGDQNGTTQSLETFQYLLWQKRWLVAGEVKAMRRLFG